MQEPRLPDSEAANVDDVPPSTEVETKQRRECDVKELRRRLKPQRAQSSLDRDTVETRLDQLARFFIDYGCLLYTSDAADE